MAGRGRGQTRAKMLESMGVERSEMHQHSHSTPLESGAGRGDDLVPSPVYPPLQFQPLLLPAPTPASEYRLTLFKLDLERMRNSKFWVREAKKETDMERYSDRYKPRDDQPPLDLDWSRLPLELNPSHKPKRKKQKETKSRKRVRLDGETVSEMETRLKELEKKEREGGAKQEGDEHEEGEDEEEEESKENEEEVEDEDEELDEGTDYAQQYFDDGDDYGGGGDDDDAVDDGGYY